MKLMLVLCLNEALALAGSMHWYGHVMRRGDDGILIWVLYV